MSPPWIFEEVVVVTGSSGVASVSVVTRSILGWACWASVASVISVRPGVAVSVVLVLATVATVVTSGSVVVATITACG